MNSYKTWLSYQKSYQLAVRIFQLTKRFPTEEKYSLTDQIRRSSRSVCTNLAEAYMRRRYKDYFISKLNDTQSENSETEVWLDFCLEFQYITKEEHFELIGINREVGRLIWYMIKNPNQFC